MKLLVLLTLLAGCATPDRPYTTQIDTHCKATVTNLIHEYKTLIECQEYHTTIWTKEKPSIIRN